MTVLELINELQKMDRPHCEVFVIRADAFGRDQYVPVLGAIDESGRQVVIDTPEQTLC